MGNVNKATAVGVGAGGLGTTLIAYAAQYAEQKYGIPFALTTAALGTAAGAFMRWAAKLHPAQ